MLVALGIISEDVVIGLMSTTIMRVWLAMWPMIESERNHRLQTYPLDVSPGFLVYYEHLVTRIYELGGRNASTAIQRRIGVRRLGRNIEQ
jgi:hypothetical protein